MKLYAVMAKCPDGTWALEYDWEGTMVCETEDEARENIDNLIRNDKQRGNTYEYRIAVFEEEPGK